MKEFFVSRYYEVKLINSIAFCTSNDMELLRIESQDELAAFIRAVKLNCDSLKGSTFVDGIKLNDGRWVFMANQEELDPNIYDLTEEFHRKEVKSCMSFLKNFPSSKLKSSECDIKQKFVCQRTSKTDTKSTNLSPLDPIKVDLSKIFFDEIDNFYIDQSVQPSTKSKYFVNREGSLSPTSTSRFCQNFNMNLINISSKEKFKSLIKQIVTTEKNFNPNMIIGGTRFSILKAQPWVKVAPDYSSGEASLINYKLLQIPFHPANVSLVKSFRQGCKILSHYPTQNTRPTKAP